MKASGNHRERKPKVLCQLEKLEPQHPGLLPCVRECLRRGIKMSAIPGLLNAKFGVSVTDRMVDRFRTRRWLPQQERIQAKVETMAAIQDFGGDAGLDAAALAKLWEQMDQMTIPQLISARALFIKVRAQNLKEQEFLYKTGQLKPGGGQEADRETQQRNVLRRVKEVFGLADDDEPPVPVPASVGAAGTK